MKTHRILLLSGTLCVLASMPQMVGACVLAYTDSYVDTTQSTVSAWSTVEDYFNDPYCYQQIGYWGYFEHSYEARVSITSPTQNWVSDEDAVSNVPYGGGSASAFISVSYVGDPGDYEINWWNWIFCSAIWDWFVDEFLTGLVNAGGGGMTCGGIPAVMANEYLAPTPYVGGVDPELHCSDFRWFPPDWKVSPNFRWGELNGGFANGNPHTGWGHIKLLALIKLQLTRAQYGMGIVISSGYRCPHGNIDPTVGGVINSLHMQGHAFDLYKEGALGQPYPYWTEAEFNLLKAKAEVQGFVESFPYGEYPDHHYHVAFSI